MKKVLISLSALVLVVSFAKCGPAAEDRFKMHENAKRISDSIAKDIDDALAKGAIPGTSTVQPTPADTVKAPK